MCFFKSRCNIQRAKTGRGWSLIKMVLVITSVYWKLTMAGTMWGALHIIITRTACSLGRYALLYPLNRWEKWCIGRLHVQLWRTEPRFKYCFINQYKWSEQTILYLFLLRRDKEAELITQRDGDVGLLAFCRWLSVSRSTG